MIHCQYVASTAKGRELRALDLLFADFIEGLFADQTGISLGTAVQPTTGKPDFGLIRWKESLGGKAIQVPSFRIDLIS